MTDKISPLRLAARGSGRDDGICFHALLRVEPQRPLLCRSVVSLIPMIQLFMQRKEPGWLMLVPVSAQYSLLNTSLRGEAPALSQLALSWLVPSALIAMALIAVARRLSRESILSGR